MTHIRPATSADIDEICQLGDEVNALHHDNAPSLFAAPGDPHRHAAHWLSTLDKTAAATFVAELDTAMVGFVTVLVVTESHSLLQPLRFARIGTVGVSASQRGQGTGKALMACAQTWAKAQGATEIRLTVAAFNEGAVRLYQELGYEVRTHQFFKAL